jgi:hypothetical protein
MPGSDVTHRNPAIIVGARHIEASDCVLFDRHQFILPKMKLPILTENNPSSRTDNSHPRIIVHVFCKPLFLVPPDQNRRLERSERLWQARAKRAIKIEY